MLPGGEPQEMGKGREKKEILRSPTKDNPSLRKKIWNNDTSGSDHEVYCKTKNECKTRPSS